MYDYFLGLNNQVFRDIIKSVYYFNEDMQTLCERTHAYRWLAPISFEYFNALYFAISIQTRASLLTFNKKRTKAI